MTATAASGARVGVPVSPGASRLAGAVTALRRSLFGAVEALEPGFVRAADLIGDALAVGGKVLAAGNGGSAADAEHLVAELVGRFGYDRRPLPAIALTANSSQLTAIANDYGYEQAFARQVTAWGRPGDVFVGISTSGRSPNVLAALQTARAAGMATVALVGGAASPMHDAADVALAAPARETPRIQEFHILLIHALCHEVEQRLFPKPEQPAPAVGLLAPDQLDGFAAAIRGRRAVFTNGCFDVLHAGHVTLLAQARSLGELLIVGLNTDDSVRRLKGPSRPVHRLADRAAVLLALAAVDVVIPFAEDTPARLIEALTPAVLVKGGDYRRETVVGADWVEQHGGEVRLLPLVPDHSTTAILARGGGGESR